MALPNLIPASFDLNEVQAKFAQVQNLKLDNFPCTHISVAPAVRPSTPQEGATVYYDQSTRQLMALNEDGTATNITPTIGGVFVVPILGVGVAAPAHALSVLGGSASNIEVGAWESNGAYTAISLNGNMALGANFYTAPTQPLIINRPTGNSISFRENNTEQMLIATGGKVGIGANPTSALQVVGLPVYANNAAAIAGGLTVGAFYRTGADPDPVCVVH